MIKNVFKCVLVVGLFSGYGLLLCIVVVFGGGVVMIGVFFEKLGIDKKLGIVGFYNVVVFDKLVYEVGLYVKSLNGDVFLNEVK